MERRHTVIALYQNDRVASMETDYNLANMLAVAIQDLLLDGLTLLYVAWHVVM
jgi:hypothetical protein